MIKFNIKLIRVKLNMQQNTLIELTGIRQSTISAFENNRAKTISIDQINKLCKALKCDVGDIMEYIPDDK